MERYFRSSGGELSCFIARFFAIDACKTHQPEPFVICESLSVRGPDWLPLFHAVLFESSSCSGQCVVDVFFLFFFFFFLSFSFHFVFLFFFFFFGFSFPVPFGFLAVTTLVDGRLGPKIVLGSNKWGRRGQKGPENR